MSLVRLGKIQGGNTHSETPEYRVSSAGAPFGTIIQVGLGSGIETELRSPPLLGAAAVSRYASIR